jgi:hypothetical protein
MTRLTDEELDEIGTRRTLLGLATVSLRISERDAMIAEVRERRAREDWQPIDSAPREQLVLLGWPDTHNEYCGYWDENGWTDAIDHQVFPHQPTHFKRLTLGPYSLLPAGPQER